MENEVLKLILSVEDKSVIKATQEAKRLEKEIKALVATEKVLGKEHEIVKQKTIEIKRKLQDYANISSQKAVPTLKKLIQTERTLSLEVDKNTAALTRNTKATKLAADASNQYGTYSITAGKKLNTFNMRVQQTGYQLQDFVVQLQSGTSFFTAFGQQGSQLAGIFGPAGAVFGAVIALGSALGGLAYAAITGKESLKDLGDASSDLESSVSGLENAYSNLDNSEFFDKFGSLKTTFQDLNSLTISLAENISNLEAASAIKAVAATVTEGGPSVFRPAAMGGLSINDMLMAGGIGKAQTKAASAGVSESLGGAVSAGQVEVYFKQFEKLADGPVEQLRDKMLEFLNVVKESPKGLGEANLEGLNLLQTIDAVTQSLGRQIALTDGSAQAIKDSAQAEADLLDEVEDLYALMSKEEKDRAKAQKQAARQRVKDAKTYAAGEAAMLKILKKKADDRNKAEITFLKIMQASMNERQKGLDAEQKINDLVDKRRNSMLDQGDLLKHEVFLRTAYKDETYIQERLEQKKLDLYIKQADLNETQAGRLRAALNYLVDQKQALKDLNEQESIRLHLQNLQVKAIEESPAGQALRKYGARGTRSDKDPIFGTGSREGKSIYSKASNKAIKETIDLTRELSDAQKQQVAIADSVSGAFGDFFMGLVDGTTSAKDAFRSMAADIIQQLYRILVVEQLVQSISGAITGAFTPAPYAGEGTAPPVAPRGNLLSLDGGGYTGSGPRSGGLDGKGGFMAMLHPRETVVDHTKGQGSGGTVVNQVFNISANTSDDTKRLVTQTIAQASPAIINQSVGAVMNQRRRGGAMKSAFG